MLLCLLELTVFSHLYSFLHLLREIFVYHTDAQALEALPWARDPSTGSGKLLT